MKKLILIVTLIICFACSIFTFVGCNSSKKVIGVDNNGNDIVNGGIYEMPTSISLMSAGPRPTVYDDKIEFILTATVLPADAPDKSLDWSVYWITNPFDDSEPVSNYINVEPFSDGSNKCNVIAKKSFGNGVIGVQATTRVGHFTATCRISYEGKPSRIRLHYNDQIYTGFNTLHMYTGTHNLTLEAWNPIGPVAEKYSNFKLTNLTVSGSFVAEKLEIVNGTITSREDVVLTANDYIDKFFSASINGSTLTITLVSTVENFVYPGNNVRTGTKYVYKEPYYDPRGGGRPSTVRPEITIHETVSNEILMFEIKTLSSISSVSLDDYGIVL